MAVFTVNTENVPGLVSRDEETEAQSLDVLRKRTQIVDGKGDRSRAAQVYRGLFRVQRAQGPGVFLGVSVLVPPCLTPSAACCTEVLEAEGTAPVRSFPGYCRQPRALSL